MLQKITVVDIDLDRTKTIAGGKDGITLRNAKNHTKLTIGWADVWEACHMYEKKKEIEDDESLRGIITIEEE